MEQKHCSTTSKYGQYLDKVAFFTSLHSNNFSSLTFIYISIQDSPQEFIHFIGRRGILNPKKIIFVVSEGNLLRHIIAKSGIKVDPERVSDITQIHFLGNKKFMQSFLGKINFLLKFIFDYTQIVKPMQEMLRKDAIYKWEKG